MSKDKLRKDKFQTDAEIPIQDVYRPRALEYERDLADPGEFPYTRGVQKTMYRGKLWTMRQYAGFGTAAESNARYKYLLSQGTTGLSVAFDLPHAGIGVDGDNQLSAQRFGAAEITHVSHVQQVETAVGQDDLLTVAPPLGDLCL